MNSKLKETLMNNKEQYIKHLMDLISIDTQVIGHGINGGKEKEGQLYIKKLLEELDGQVIVEQMEEETIIKALESYNEGNLNHNYEDRFNLIGDFKGKGDKTLLFNGHVDTMPPGDISKWKINPWKPEIIDGKLYGLGAADMKSGLIASIMAVKLLKDAGIELPVNVKILSVVDEEGGGNGTIHAVTKGVKADGAVICEPSDNKIINAHMGFIFFEVEVSGIALHSGKKWEGINAIEKAIKLINALNELEHQWLMKYKHKVLPAPTINVGVIKGGTAGSTVPDNCKFKMCIHYLPEVMSYEMVKNDVINTLNLCANGDSYLKDNPPIYNIYQAGGAFEMDENHSFVSKVKEAYSEATDSTSIVDGSCAGNDARLLKNIANIPTVILGPGALEQCHTINEYVKVEEYLNHILIYANLILNFDR
ncbi:M20 family metallopeptidase [Clostridium sp. Marseille-QA1073]